MKQFAFITLFIVAFFENGFSQAKLKNAKTKQEKTMSTATKMKVEIWSDIMCPFCYIGKRHYEAAIANFADSANVEVVWKSFQLDPSLPKPASKLSTYAYLAERKGMSVEQSKALHQNVVEMAKNAGLNYDFDKAVVANSFDAHRLIQFAKTKGLGDEAEERLFKAYFMEGKDMSDVTTLVDLGKEIGLNESEVKEVVNSTAYTNEVNSDIEEAHQIGVQGVPFFVFDRKYAISGAQPVEAFTKTLEKSFSEWRKENPSVKLEVSEGKVCTPDKECK
ncbi:MAG: DsbA family oxidoreductase [Sphingobacteriaceae bacterium]|jgi:predicted DsbA family dithiol-disulfide isomerase